MESSDVSLSVAVVSVQGMLSEVFELPPSPKTVGEIQEVPEISLLFEALRDGIDKLFFTSAADPKMAKLIRADSRTWLMSNDRTYLFSFVTLCEIFSLDANKIRRELRHIIDTGKGIKGLKEEG